MTTTPNPCDPRTQQARQDALDALYLADGRADASHPCHAVYTGLVQQQPPATPAQ